MKRAVNIIFGILCVGVSVLALGIIVYGVPFLFSTEFIIDDSTFIKTILLSVIMMIAGVFFLKDSFNKDVNLKIKHYLKYFFYFVYGMVLLYIFILRHRNPYLEYSTILENANFIPFIYVYNTIIDFLSDSAMNSGIYRLIGQIIIFAPLVHILNISKIGYSKFVVIVLIISVCTKLFQLLFKSGVIIIDDIILNVFGCVLYYSIYTLLVNKQKNFMKGDC